MFVEQLAPLHLIVSWNESLWDPRVLAARYVNPLASSFSWSLHEDDGVRRTWVPSRVHDLLTCSDCTLRTIDLARNTTRRPACGFHANDEAPLKLA
ncbi:hypothetical protein AVEN_209637-1 [Araneus ventricosus]|uniref:Uncharacterized protein n=1 Tax=Araneus ventricosus TaxID=182803 RepID=A0A4Y2D587_ARAVE|nr:hypothetical protein AVEN_209637-1 [Araneus ventricosus]